ncbi:MAG: cell envelope integrity protein CreD [Elusimicrobia bacterium]|nr:cell envelope integrity protein CreD [Elusimicrobiota bacterium]
MSNKERTIWKLVVIGGLILLMLIPLWFVSGVIRDRVRYRDNATRTVTDSWGGRLLVAAPVLNIPYTVRTACAVTNTMTVARHYVKIAPRELNADVNINSQTRRIGIFEVPVFTADFNLSGNFGKLENIDISTLHLNEAFITLETNNLSGISPNPVLKWNGAAREFEPSTAGRALQADITRLETRQRAGRVAERSQAWQRPMPLRMLSSRVNFTNDDVNYFEMQFSLRGSDSVSFVPVAKNNHFNVTSNWAIPNFSGNFLPDSREVTDSGWNAQWHISYLASGIPAIHLEAADFSPAIFTTTLLLLIDNHRAAERATKYGILFIILTFLACFIVEITSKKPVHPFQYLLVGAALTIFYILLLSISEFMSFALAYTISAVATTGLITAYAKFAIAKTMPLKYVAAIFIGLSTLYTYLYILLQLEDMALLFGSISIFVGLAIAMYVTRNINWYE